MGELRLIGLALCAAVTIACGPGYVAGDGSGGQSQDGVGGALDGTGGQAVGSGGDESGGASPTGGGGSGGSSQGTGGATASGGSVATGGASMTGGASSGGDTGSGGSEPVEPVVVWSDGFEGELTLDDEEVEMAGLVRLLLQPMDYPIDLGEIVYEGAEPFSKEIPLDDVIRERLADPAPLDMTMIFAKTVDADDFNHSAIDPDDPTLRARFIFREFTYLGIESNQHRGFADYTWELIRDP